MHFGCLQFWLLFVIQKFVQNLSEPAVAVFALVLNRIIFRVLIE